MKMGRKITKIGMGLALTGLLVLPMTATAGMGKGFGGGNCGQCPATLMTLAKGELSAEETATLLHMREEEKLARDVYLTLYEQWGHQTFANIARSEQRHMNTMKALIDKYELTDPVTDDARGVFTEEFQSLYEQLTTTGQGSLVEALKAGATIEELDIKDLQNALTESDDEDARTAYQNLMKGSRNHLRAFVYQLSLNNAEYTPQYITAETYEAIISSPVERGYYNEDGEPVGGFGCGRNGRGNRRGQGGCIGPNAGLFWNADENLLSRGGNGPGDGTGNGGDGPKDGTGNGKKSGDCVNSATSWNANKNLISRGGYGPGDGTGNGGNGPKDGTGNGSKSGDCIFFGTSWNADKNLISRGGNGPGDGTGNGGDGPKDGTGNGSKSGDCVNSATSWNADKNLICRGGNGGGNGNGGGGGNGPGDGTGNGGNGPKDGTGNGKKRGTCVNS